MRIACIHIPQFALQSVTRLDPSLRGAPVAVISSVGPGAMRGAGVLHAPIVLACSRAAWAVGVRLGMTATAARALAADLRVVTADLVHERETVRAIADSLLALTSLVDVGGRVGAGGAHLALYAEVPAKMRGTTFGERLLDVLDELGLTARVGIADDRFTAWVAAAHGGAPGLGSLASLGPAAQPNPNTSLSIAGGEDHGVVSVPRGGSAAFLAPRPLSLLAIPTEVQHMLEALGVRTLGEFAALPAPSIARPLEADYQALARGESGAQLRPYTPEAPIREEVVVSAGNVLELDGSVGSSAAIALIARRIALRLAGRGRCAARLEVSATRDDGEREIPVTLDHVVSSAEDVARALGPVLEATAAAPGSWRLRVLVAGEALADGDAEAPLVADSPFAVESTFGRAASVASRQPEPELAGTISPLAVVLSSTGSLFALSPPQVRSERRDTHRRTRRGKHRRTRPTPVVQPRLFDRTSTK